LIAEKCAALLGCLFTDFEVEDRPDFQLVCVDVDQPRAEELHDIVQVVLTPTTFSVGGCRGFCACHVSMPAIITPNCQDYVAIIVGERSCEVLRRLTDVEVGVQAVPTWCADAFFLGDLHDPLLASAANCRRVASGFLHSKGRQKNGRKVILLRMLLEKRQERLAGVEGTFGTLKRRVQIHEDDLVNGYFGRSPSRWRVDSTVKPALHTIWPDCRGDRR